MKKETPLLSVLALLAALPATAQTIAPAGSLRCTVQTENVSTAWLIEFDETIPLASVDDSDRPADYTPSHIRIRLARDGPVLTIGRVSGRILATDRDGKAIGAGRCTAPAVI